VALVGQLPADIGQEAAPYTVWWWLRQLEDALVARTPSIDLCEAYYEGQHNLAFATSKFRESFGRLFREFSDNWCELVVDSSVERIAVQGFRFTKEDLSGDDDAWRIWQANGLDSESVIAHTTAVKTGMAYLLVGPGEDEPEVTVEHPCEVIVAMAPGRRVRQAALKRWVDDLGVLNAYVYLPGGVFIFRGDKPVGEGDGSPVWEYVAKVRNRLGVVPVVPLPNDPDGRGFGTSDIAQVSPTQDAVNKLIADAMISSEFASFPQRFLTGVEIPDDAQGREMVAKLASGAMRVWNVDSPDAKFGQLEASDMKGFVSMIELIVQHIAARTRTPPHYLLGQSGNFPSGDSLKATETGLVAKVRKKHLFFGEAWEEAIRLAFQLKGDSRRGSDMRAETLWKDPESRSFGELVDGLVKLATLGVPQEFLWARAGYSPQEIARMQELAAAQFARQQLLQPKTPAKDPTAELETGLPADPTGAAAQVAR
jgi:hypothetical protein